MKLFIPQILSATFLISTASCQETRQVKVTVTEENGALVEAARVSVDFLGYQGSQDAKEKGLSDPQGVFEAQGKALLDIQASVSKEGYYETKLPRLGKGADHDITCVLRKKINPIALHAKKLTLYFPKNREWIGYDFEFGDWVSPDGAGKIADVYFKCDTKATDWAKGKGSFEMKFENKAGYLKQTDNYLPTSEMKIPHKAPLKGYTSLLIRDEDSHHNKKLESNIGYFFRTRVEEVDGEIQSANYGKISNDISFDPRESGWHVAHKERPKSYGSINFTYYFNPTPNDRNLEFDPTKNLFKGLGSSEQVREP